jgi:hypothetical protein
MLVISLHLLQYTLYQRQIVQLQPDQMLPHVQWQLRLMPVHNIVNGKNVKRQQRMWLQASMEKQACKLWPQQHFLCAGCHRIQPAQCGRGRRGWVLGVRMGQCILGYPGQAGNPNRWQRPKVFTGGRCAESENVSTGTIYRLHCTLHCMPDAPP